MAADTRLVPYHWGSHRLRYAINEVGERLDRIRWPFDLIPRHPYDQAKVGQHSDWPQRPR